ncbi:hypothetical protein CC79DRAFT_1366564 [Sarocladium strictum]
MANITFGVELEFVLPNHALPRQPRHFDEHMAFKLHHVVKWLLEDLGLPVAVQCACIDDRIRALPCHGIPDLRHQDGAYSICLHPGAPQNRFVLDTSHYYFVQSDEVEPFHDEAWNGVEIATPVRNLSTLSQQSSELTQFLTNLRNWSTPLGVTDKCGLHIHVGESTHGLTLNAAKRVLTMVALLERHLLTQLVSPDRHTNDYWRPMMTQCRFAQQAAAENRDPHPGINAQYTFGHSANTFWARNRRTVGVFIEHVWAQTTLPNLCNGIASDVGKASLSISFRPGPPAATDPKQCSVEFRYPQISFSARFIQMWCIIAGRIMELCSEGNDARYRRALEQILADLDEAVEERRPVVLELITSLGLGNRLDEFDEIIQNTANGWDESLEDDDGLNGGVKTPTKEKQSDDRAGILEFGKGRMNIDRFL